MKLQEIVRINTNFKSSINLYLNLNNEEKLNSYIPTTSSVKILNRYVDSILDNNNQSNILIGPYGKGKSHLLLFFLAMIAKENDEVFLRRLVEKVAEVDSSVSNKLLGILSSEKKLLPIIISNSQDDLNQTFMIALNNALKRAGLSDLMPDTFFTSAIDMINSWKKNYKETYEKLGELVSNYYRNVNDLVGDLRQCDEKALSVFKEVYPNLTSGNIFNPLAGGDVLIMYKSVAEKLREVGYTGLYIVFDEFSKYIEAQDKKAAGKNMKILQDLCELANDSKDPQIFITYVAHKSIKEYGDYLSKATINAFTGIEGRIQDFYFDTSSKNNYELIKNAIKTDVKKLDEIPDKERYFGEELIESFYKLPAFKSSFEYSDFVDLIVKGCFPLNPLTTYCLFNVSERVAQNERTLFTFISKDEEYTLARFVREHNLNDSYSMDVSVIYDYFKVIFKKDVFNEAIHNEWLNAEYALKKANNNEDEVIIKTIAVVNIVNKVDELPASIEIIKLASGIPNAEEVIRRLEDAKVLYKVSSNNTYRFKTRAGSELKKEIKNRRELKGKNVNIANSLHKLSPVKYVIPRKYNYKYRMTRYFNYEFMLVEDFLAISDLRVLMKDKRVLDGKVIALLSTSSDDYTEDIYKKLDANIIDNLVVLYSRKIFNLEKELLDYEIIQDLKSDISFMQNNEVLHNELLLMESEISEQIEGYIYDAFDNSNRCKTIYVKNELWSVIKKYPVEKAVDEVCAKVYSNTLVINNELINKNVISSTPIKKAQKTIIDSVLNKKIDDSFINGTGPESTIYRAVLINTGINCDIKSAQTAELLDLFVNYVDSCIENKVQLSELTNMFFAPPYGMRAGVLPIILAYVISYRNEDIIAYYKNREIDIDVDSIVNMCEHPDEYSLFISKEDARKEEYLKSLIETFDPDCYASLTGTRITNVLTCMQRWYRSLPQVAKNIKNVNDYIDDERIIGCLPKFRSIMNKVDGNAYEMIFSDIPQTLTGKNDLKSTVETLEKIKTFLAGYMSWIQDSVIIKTKELFGGNEKLDIQHTMFEWYEKQSQLARFGVQDNNISSFMNFLTKIDTYDERDFINRLSKIVTGIYMDAWDDNTFGEYLVSIQTLKEDVENINDTDNSDKLKLSFTDSTGVMKDMYYEKSDDSSADILRNILSDTLDDFSSLSLNDKIAILVETLEEIIKKEE